MNGTKSPRKVTLLLSLAGLYGFTLLFFSRTAEIHTVLLALAVSPWAIWLSERDFSTYELPDTGAFALAICGLINWSFLDVEALLPHGIASVAVLVLFWILGELYFRLRQIEGFGIGDAKLFAVCTFILGPEYLPGFVIIASVGGIIGAWLNSTEANRHGIAFGPYILYAMFLMIFLDPLI